MPAASELLIVIALTRSTWRTTHAGGDTLALTSGVEHRQHAHAGSTRPERRLAWVQTARPGCTGG